MGDSLEVAPFVRAGVGRRTDTVAALGDLSFDVALTFPVFDVGRGRTGQARAGVWLAPAATDFRAYTPQAGLRLEWRGENDRSDFIKAYGRPHVVLDSGVGTRAGRTDAAFGVARLAGGFAAPMRLFGLYGRHCSPAKEWPFDPEAYCRPAAGIVSGVRLYVQLRKDFDAGRADVTGGIEVELIGLTWWLLGAR